MTRLEILDAVADREMTEVSTGRLAEIREGRQELLDEDDFWIRAALTLQSRDSRP